MQRTHLIIISLVFLVVVPAVTGNDLKRHEKELGESAEVAVDAKEEGKTNALQKREPSNKGPESQSSAKSPANSEDALSGIPLPADSKWDYDPAPAPN